MGLFDAIGGMVTSKRAQEEAKKQRKFVNESRQQGMDMVANMDWEPELVSDHAPMYQRSQSPIADAFLQSMLTGQNPNMVQGTRQGSPQLKAAAQRGFDQSYGGFDALRQRQRDMEAATPWAVKPFDGPAITQGDMRAASKPAFTNIGLSDDDLAILKAAGFDIDPATGKDMAGNRIHQIQEMNYGAGRNLQPTDWPGIAGQLRAGQSDYEAIGRSLRGGA